MPTKFAMTRDINGYNGFGVPFTDVAYSATLATSTDTSLTVPSIEPLGSASFSLDTTPTLLAVFNFTPGASVWVAKNATAIVPAGASFGATTSELNPAARQVQGGDVLHFISAGTAVDVSVLFYWLT